MRLPLAALISLAPLLVFAGDGTVQLKKSDGTIEITIDDKPFATYHFKGYEKPFLIDVRAPGGTVITRLLDDEEAAKEHPHHKGLWLSVDQVNEHRHWMEAQPIRTEKVEILKAEGDPASFRVTNVWLDEAGKPLLNETTTAGISADRLVSYDITLKPAGDGPITFGDTKEGFFAIRLRNELTENKGTGKIVNSEGAKGEKQAWGQTAPWVDYSGTVDGKAVGVAIFDYPNNFRPSRYHVRGYGLFAVSPFGEHDYTQGKNDAKPVTLKPGDILRLRYAAFIHSGDAETADVAGRFEQYVKQTTTH